MRVYTIHTQNFSSTLGNNVIIVREGFCWTAFFAPPLWAVTHRMWFSTLGFSAIYILIFLFEDFFGLERVTTLSLLIGAATIIGFCANDWRRTSLKSRGWHFAGLAAAPDQDAALRRFINLRQEAADLRVPAQRF